MDESWMAASGQMEKKAELSSASASARQFVCETVTDWEDDGISRARFKAFSGQRSDWQSTFVFWRDLILAIARHFGLIFLTPLQVKQWFLRAGLTPLCIDHVLSLMSTEGDFIPSTDLLQPHKPQTSLLFRKLRGFLFKFSTAHPRDDEILVVSSVLKEKAEEVVNLLSQGHWTSSCILTMTKFQNICGGYEEASAIFTYLYGCGKANYLSTTKNILLEGVKVSLTEQTISGISNLDHDVLFLTSTLERLQQQLNVIDSRHELSRNSALASLHSANKKFALRYARELKILNVSRDKCTNLLNRVEEVINVIAEAESTKMVSEAIKIGARALKENKVDMEEVQLSLQELDESITWLKQVESVLDPVGPLSDIDDEEIEEELEKLELEVRSKMEEGSVPSSETKKVEKEREELESGESLIQAFSNLAVADSASVPNKSGVKNLAVAE